MRRPAASSELEACSIRLDTQQRHALGLLPSPPELGPAQVRALLDWPKSGKPDFGWGGVGGGGHCCEVRLVHYRTTPPRSLRSRPSPTRAGLSHVSRYAVARRVPGLVPLAQSARCTRPGHENGVSRTSERQRAKIRDPGAT